MLPEPSSRKMRDSGACTGPTAGEGCGEMTWDGAELGVRASDRERFSFRMVSKRPSSSYGVRGYLAPRRGANECDAFEAPPLLGWQQRLVLVRPEPQDMAVWDNPPTTHGAWRASPVMGTAVREPLSARACDGGRVGRAWGGTSAPVASRGGHPTEGRGGEGHRHLSRGREHATRRCVLHKATVG